MDPQTPATGPVLATVPARAVLTVDGIGDPADAAFAAAVRALLAVRTALGAPADVPVEGSYAQDGDPLRFDLDAPAGWHWTLLVPAPDAVFAEAVTAAGERFGAAVHLRRPAAQRVAQLLHHGPYSEEGPSLHALYRFVAAQGLVPDGPHTEVYLTDPGVTAPRDNRTVLRVPVR